MTDRNSYVDGYVNSPKLTENLETFVAWVVENGDADALYTTKAAREAFRHGVYVGIKSYSHYQAFKNADRRAEAKAEREAEAARAEAAAKRSTSTVTPKAKPAVRKSA